MCVCVNLTIEAADGVIRQNQCHPIIRKKKKSLEVLIYNKQNKFNPIPEVIIYIQKYHYD